MNIYAASTAITNLGFRRYSCLTKDVISLHSPNLFFARSQVDQFTLFFLYTLFWIASFIVWDSLLLFSLSHLLITHLIFVWLPTTTLTDEKRLDVWDAVTNLFCCCRGTLTDIPPLIGSNLKTMTIYSSKYYPRSVSAYRRHFNSYYYHLWLWLMLGLKQ